MDLNKSLQNLALQPIKALYLNYHISCDHQTWQGGCLQRGVPSTNLQDPLIIWPSEIKRQTKTIISPLPQCLWPPNLAGCRKISPNIITPWQYPSGNFPQRKSAFRLFASYIIAPRTNGSEESCPPGKLPQG